MIQAKQKRETGVNHEARKQDGTADASQDLHGQGDSILACDWTLQSMSDLARRRAASGSYRDYVVRLRLDRTGSADTAPYAIHCSRDVHRLMHPLADESAQLLYSISLDAAEQVAGVYQICKHACDYVAGDPREVFKAALLTNASRIVLVRNEPSGRVEPRQADYAFAERIRDGGRLLRINLLDSLIIGGERYFSMADAGVLGKDLRRLRAVAGDMARRRSHRLKTGAQ